MGKKNINFIHAQDIASSYSDFSMNDRFRQGIKFYSTGGEDDVILNPCSTIERARMNTISETYVLYFYFYLHVILELGVLIPFTLFEVEFLLVVKAAPSQITQNIWSMLRDF